MLEVPQPPTDEAGARAYVRAYLLEHGLDEAEAERQLAGVPALPSAAAYVYKARVSLAQIDDLNKRLAVARRWSLTAPLLLLVASFLMAARPLLVDLLGDWIVFAPTAIAGLALYGMVQIARAPRKLP